MIVGHPVEMKWTLIILLGSSLALTTVGWTYHYSNITVNWTEARQHCKTYYTDMVVIQSQEENNYLVSLLPDRDSSPYYWIGITKSHMNETWTWVGNNSTWIGNDSWAENEPNNNHSTEFCVEIYVNKGKNRGKWNDEKCSRPKSPVCYKAQCNATSCGRGTCQETMENITCKCEPGYKGDRCQTAVECPHLPQPDNGDFSCFGGNQTFNSTCQLKCHQGYLVIGSSSITCGATGVWNGPRPICTTVECPHLPQPDNGDFSCFGGNQTFNSTCQLKCHQGYLVIGSSSITCGATGVWNGPRPICTSYKQALLAVAGCGALSAFCCICFCWMKHKKRKKLTQVREPEEASSPSSEVQG